ncbi:DUF4190 domain-containing protein [Agrococcus sp. ProA11]|uniref:DUF4190 domain-containing protein n=1 Tax=Agrococcus chionoecetis TaxID=3153752 RepID=UPI00325FE221
MTNSPNPASSSQSSPAGQGFSGDPAPRMLSIASLVLGIASVFLGLTFLVPIAGIITGVMARKREPEGRTMALWGIWLSVVMLVLGILLWVTVGGIILATFGLAASV